MTAITLTPDERRNLAMRSFGAYVKTRRTLQNQRQTDVAEQVRAIDPNLKMHPRDIYAYEVGTRLPTLETVSALLAAIGGKGDDLQLILRHVAEYATGSSAEARLAQAEAYGRTLAIQAHARVDGMREQGRTGADELETLLAAARTLPEEERAATAAVLSQLAADPEKLRQLVTFGTYLAGSGGEGNRRS